MLGYRGVQLAIRPDTHIACVHFHLVQKKADLSSLTLSTAIEAKLIDVKIDEL